MRLLSYAAQGGARLGVLAPDQTIVDVDALLDERYPTMLALIDAGPAAWSRLARAAGRAAAGTPLASAGLLAPITRPRRNVFCVGWNYAEHFQEGRRAHGGGPEVPEHPAFFSKNPGTVVGHEAPVWHSAPHSKQLDWEVELAVVIGRAGRDIPEEHALQFVFGYTVANDVSVRDVQRGHGGQWFKWKNFDTHLPLGPWVVTADELPDARGLRITSRINGMTKQDSSTAHMVFSVARIISELSAGLALEPGDVVITGTPEGVGFARTPPEFLQVGDVMEMEIEGIGVLRNAVRSFPR